MGHTGNMEGMGGMERGNRSQVLGSTFRVKGKEGIKELKLSLKMLIFPNNCRRGFKSWVRPDEAEKLNRGLNKILSYEFLMLNFKFKAKNYNIVNIQDITFRFSHFTFDVSPNF